MEEMIILSTLPKTWIFDLDGTLVKHNGYREDGRDTLLAGVREYFAEIPPEDKIILITSRTDKCREQTVCFLREKGIRYDEILFNMPLGERILVNDRKPSGLETAVAVNLDRDVFEMPLVDRIL